MQENIDVFFFICKKERRRIESAVRMDRDRVSRGVSQKSTALGALEANRRMAARSGPGGSWGAYARESVFCLVRKAADSRQSYQKKMRK